MDVDAYLKWFREQNWLVPAAVKIQAWWRGIVANRRYDRMKNAIHMFRARCVAPFLVSWFHGARSRNQRRRALLIFGLRALMRNSQLAKDQTLDPDAWSASALFKKKRKTRKQAVMALKIDNFMQKMALQKLGHTFAAWREWLSQRHGFLQAAHDKLKALFAPTLKRFAFVFRVWRALTSLKKSMIGAPTAPTAKYAPQGIEQWDAFMAVFTLRQQHSRIATRMFPLALMNRFMVRLQHNAEHERQKRDWLKRVDQFAVSLRQRRAVKGWLEYLGDRARQRTVLVFLLQEWRDACAHLKWLKSVEDELRKRHHDRMKRGALRFWLRDRARQVPLSLSTVLRLRTNPALALLGVQLIRKDTGVRVTFVRCWLAWSGLAKRRLRFRRFVAYHIAWLRRCIVSICFSAWRNSRKGKLAHNKLWPEVMRQAASGCYKMWEASNGKSALLPFQVGGDLRAKRRSHFVPALPIEWLQEGGSSLLRRVLVLMLGHWRQQKDWPSSVAKQAQARKLLHDLGILDSESFRTLVHRLQQMQVEIKTLTAARLLREDRAIWTETAFEAARRLHNIRHEYSLASSLLLHSKQLRQSLAGQTGARSRKSIKPPLPAVKKPPPANLAAFNLDEDILNDLKPQLDRPNVILVNEFMNASPMAPTVTAPPPAATVAAMMVNSEEAAVLVDPTESFFPKDDDEIESAGSSTVNSRRQSVVSSASLRRMSVTAMEDFPSPILMRDVESEDESDGSDTASQDTGQTHDSEEIARERRRDLAQMSDMARGVTAHMLAHQRELTYDELALIDSSYHLNGSDHADFDPDADEADPVADEVKDDLARARAQLEAELAEKFDLPPPPPVAVLGHTGPVIVGHPYWGMNMAARFDALDTRYRTLVSQQLPAQYFEDEPLPEVTPPPRTASPLTIGARRRNTRINITGDDPAPPRKGGMGSLAAELSRRDSSAATLTDSMQSANAAATRERLPSIHDALSPQQSNKPSGGRPAKSLIPAPDGVAFLPNVGGAVRFAQRERAAPKRVAHLRR